MHLEFYNTEQVFKAQKGTEIKALNESNTYIKVLIQKHF